MKCILPNPVPGQHRIWGFGFNDVQVLISFWLPARVMDAMQVGRHNDDSQPSVNAVGNTYIGMGKYGDAGIQQFIDQQ
ncbi:MAG: hypothetical protein AAGA75_23205 [Cyanobacteria bacterium P01_E01_bin.6]